MASVKCALAAVTIVLFARAILGISKMQQDCEDLFETYKTYTFGSCLVQTTASGNGLDWQSHCTHLPNGRLAVIANRKVKDAILSIMASLSVSFIGMFQYDTSDEPVGNWVWYLREGWTVPAPHSFYQVHYYASQPMNNDFGQSEECTIMDSTNAKLYDAPCNNSLGTYICEYRQQEPRVYSRIKGMKGNLNAVLWEVTVESVTHAALLCADQCDLYGSLCFSFALSGAQCILYQDTVDSSDNPIVADGNFNLYDLL